MLKFFGIQQNILITQNVLFDYLLCFAFEYFLYIMKVCIVVACNFVPFRAVAEQMLASFIGCKHPWTTVCCFQKAINSSVVWVLGAYIFRAMSCAFSRGRSWMACWVIKGGANNG